VYEEHFPSFVQLLRRWLPSGEEAQDVAQDVFSRILSHEDPDKIKNLFHFTVRSMRNGAIDWWRKQRRREISEEKLASDAVLLEDYPSAETGVLLAERLGEPFKALQQERPEAYMALVLVRFYRYKIETAAKFMGISRNKIPRLVAEALLRLESAGEQGEKK
jgi:RNA polymerase sigma factor (sigma-70 family)